MIEISNEASMAGNPEKINEDLTLELKKLEKEAISMSSADPEKYREKMELYVKQAVKLNGQEITDLKVEKLSATDDFVMKYTWTREGGNARKIETYFTAVYDQGKQNLYLHFTSFKYEKTDKPEEMMVPSSNPFQVKNTSLFYDYSIPTDNVKRADIRIEKNDKKQFEYLLDKVRSYSFHSDVNITANPDLEKTQITGLNNVALGNEIVKTADGGYTRSLFMFDTKSTGKKSEAAKMGKYRELAKIYFDANGDLDINKTATANDKAVITVLNQPLFLDVTLDKDNKKITLNKIINDPDALITKVKSHRESLISAINGGSGQWIKEDFPGIVKSVYNEKEDKRSFDTKKLNLNVIDDTYTFQRGKEADHVLKFGFDKTDVLKIKDMAGKLVDKIILPVQLSDGKVDYYRVQLIAGKLEIVVPKKFEVQSSQELPTFTDAPSTGDGSSLITASTLYYYDDKSKHIEFYNDEGLLISDVPAERNDNNERLIGKAAADVDLYDLFDIKNFDAATLKSLDLFESDVFAAFSSLFAQEKLKLSGRKVVKIFDAATKKNKYYEIDQHGTSTFVLTADKELDETAADSNDTIKNRLNGLKNIKNAKLTYKKLDGKELNFVTDLGGSEIGIGRGNIAIANKQNFLKGTTDDINQKLLRQNGAGQLDFVFTMDDAKLSKININHAKIGPKEEYDITFKQDKSAEQDEPAISLIFSPEKMKDK